jgi:hypothetical protein
MSKRDITFEYITLEKLKEIGNKLLKKIEILMFEAPLFLIKEEEIEEILHAYHVTPLGGQVGISRLLWKLKEKYVWKNKKSKIVKYAKNCIKCKANKHGTKLKVPMIITKPSNKSGPFSETHEGNRYALQICACGTNYR